RHPVSGTVSPRSSRCFSPFPHGTGSLSVTEEYLGLEGGPPTFRQDGSCPALLEDHHPGVPYGAVTRCGPPFQTLPVPRIMTTGLVRVRSPLLAESPGGCSRNRRGRCRSNARVDVLSSGY